MYMHNGSHTSQSDKLVYGSSRVWGTNECSAPEGDDLDKFVEYVGRCYPYHCAKQHFETCESTRFHGLKHSHRVQEAAWRNQIDVIKTP